MVGAKLKLYALIGLGAIIGGAEMRQSDKIWREDAIKNGWYMPPVSRWKRLPIIRHIRAAYLGSKAEEYRDMTGALGLGIGGVPQYDQWMIHGIRRGFEPVRRLT